MILSVPNTGTRFLSALTGHRSIHVHASDADIQMAADRSQPIMCPLRDPWSVYVSNYSRRGTGHAIRVDLDYAWRRLAELDRRYDIFYVPVDHDGEWQRMRLEALLGKELTNPWKPVGSFPRKEPPYKDLSWIYELPMVREFYTWQPVQA